MANIFTLENVNDMTDRINIDELYEKKKRDDLVKLDIFNKMLANVHKRIKVASRQKFDNQICWYLVPETILGVPKYDQGACIAFLMDKLKTNGFLVRYVHPNLLMISWAHWVPSYVRSELKKKTGIVVDEYGHRVQEEDEEEDDALRNGSDYNPNDYMLKGGNRGIGENKGRTKKEYTPIKSYKPSGKLVYDDDILDRIEDKFI